MKYDYSQLSREPRAYVRQNDALRCIGPDTEVFLQGQLSQDISELSDNESAWSFLLNPNGKVAVWLRVSRIADDEYLLDMDEGWGQLALNRLKRFKIRVKSEIQITQLKVTSILGEGSKKLRQASTNSGIISDIGWLNIEGFDLLGESTDAPDGCEIGTEEEYEFLRISSGVPRMGSELTEDVIPAETNLVERSVSFTKGCYTGQELVARLDSRGNRVPKHLRRLRTSGSFATGSPIEGENGSVGTVTSCAESIKGTIGLGYVSRSFEVPGEATIDGASVLIESAFT